jgi:hypothetical protein
LAGIGAMALSVWRKPGDETKSALPLWLPAAWIGGGAFFAWLANRPRASTGRPGFAVRRPMSIAVGFAAALLGAAMLTKTPKRDGMLNIAREVADEAESRAAPKEELVVLVYGEPALFYHLRALGVAAAPIAHLEIQSADGGPTIFLAAGPHAERSKEFRDALADRKGSFRPIAQYAYFPSELVWPDNYSLGESKGGRVRESVRLYAASPLSTELDDAGAQ